MALYRCGSGGVTSTETVLWENASPSSSFSEQTVQLSQSMENFDFIKVTFILSTTNGATGAIIVPIQTIMNSLNNTNNTFRTSIGVRLSGYNYVRPLFINSGVYDQLGIGSAKIPGNSGTSSTSAIPLKVIGIKNNLPINTLPDFVYSGYKRDATATWTFDHDFSKVLITSTANSSSDYGTYTGSGTVTNLYNYAGATDAYGNRYGVGVMLENVKSGDTYKFPKFTVSSTTVTFISIIGWY